jgi:hypothetical protein
MRLSWIVCIPLLCLAQAMAWADPPTVTELLQRIEALEKELATLKAQCAAMTAPAAKTDRKPPAQKVRFSGYTQARYETVEGGHPDNAFDVRRARFKFDAQPTERTRARIQVDAAGAAFRLRDGYIDYLIGHDWFVRAGQAKVPIGYELLESPTKLIALERHPLLDELFPSQRDRGVWLWREPSGRGTRVGLALYNGNGPDRPDNNGGKNVAAQVDVPLGDARAGVSGTVGTFRDEGKTGDAADDLTADRNLVALHYVLPPSPWGIQAEWFTGENAGHGTAGWYVQGAYRLDRCPGMPFLRYDWYNPTLGVPGDDFTRFSVGYAHDLNSAAKLTLQFDDVRDGPMDADRFGLQLQTIY